MAERNFLVQGLSGAGKSSVYDELIRRGYKAVSTDRAWKAAGGSDWDEAKAARELERPDPDVLFVCGGGGERFLSSFTTVFELRIDDATMRRRLEERTNNDYGKHPDELAHMLALNRRGVMPEGTVVVDATQSLERVVDEVLHFAGCNTERGSWSPPWSWDDVVATLERYLDEHGVDRTALDPRAFDGYALERYYADVNGAPADGVGYALLDAMAYLRDRPSPG